MVQKQTVIEHWGLCSHINEIRSTIMSQFSPATIMLAVNRMDFHREYYFDRFLVMHDLIGVVPEKNDADIEYRKIALVKYLAANPDKKEPSGAKVTFEIIQESLRERLPTNWLEQDTQLLTLLQLEGYVVYSDGELKPTLPEIIQLAEKKDELDSLLEMFRFDIAKKHLESAISAYKLNEWTSANAQIRNFIESLFDSIAEKLALADGTVQLPRAGNESRQMLAKQGFFSSKLNEWQFNFQGDNVGFIQGFFNRLHPSGSHPGESDQEDSTFRLNMAILVAWHFLRRFYSRTST